MAARGYEARRRGVRPWAERHLPEGAGGAPPPVVDVPGVHQASGHGTARDQDGAGGGWRGFLGCGQAPWPVRASAPGTLALRGSCRHAASSCSVYGREAGVSCWPRLWDVGTQLLLRPQEVGVHFG